MNGRASPLRGVLLACTLALLVPLPGDSQAPPPQFDAERAWGHLLQQVELGPRVPNTAGHAACRTYLEATLRPLADRVNRQDFTRRFGGKTLRLSNVIARWQGTGRIPPRNGVLLCAHWDTRPTADRERDPARRRMPIPGANDGASGTAVLLELARLFHSHPPAIPVMMVLFDGEDYGPGLDQMLLGSRYFAAHRPPDTPRRGILLDMVGDAHLQIPQEGFSRRMAPRVQRSVYATAHRLGYGYHFPRARGRDIYDDHVPLLRRGIKVVNLIDFNYGPEHSYWHTLEDTPDKCSARSLRVVGEVAAAWVYGLR